MVPSGIRTWVWADYKATNLATQPPQLDQLFRIWSKYSGGSQYWTFSSRYQWVATLTCRAARQIADFYSLLTEWWSEYWIDLVHWPFAGLNSKHLTIGLFEYQTSPVFGSLCLGLYLVQYSNAFEYFIGIPNIQTKEWYKSVIQMFL